MQGFCALHLYPKAHYVIESGNPEFQCNSALNAVIIKNVKLIVNQSMVNKINKNNLMLINLLLPYF